mgnify:CR=1 FL=1
MLWDRWRAFQLGYFKTAKNIVLFDQDNDLLKEENPSCQNFIDFKKILDSCLEKDQLLVEIN